MNQVKALLASILITGLVACVMLAVGWSALFSRPAVSVGAASNASSTSAKNTNETELRALVNQYQAREQQWRAQLAEANQQLDEKDQQLAETNRQVEQLQNVLQALAQRGIIQISADGRIHLPSR